MILREEASSRSLENVFSQLSSLFFPRRKLDGIEAPTRVEVEGTLLGEDDQRSEVTGRGGLFLEYRFYDRVVFAADTQAQRYTDRLVCWARLGDALRVDVHGSVVLVPIEPRVKFEFRGAWDPGFLPALLPDSVAAAHPELQQVREELRYDEKALHGGQRVKLVAYVDPVVAGGDGGAYRGGRGPGWDYQVRPDLGEVRLVELALGPAR